MKTIYTLIITATLAAIPVQAQKLGWIVERTGEPSEEIRDGEPEGYYFNPWAVQAFGLDERMDCTPVVIQYPHGYDGVGYYCVEREDTPDDPIYEPTWPEAPSRSRSSQRR